MMDGGTLRGERTSDVLDLGIVIARACTRHYSEYQERKITRVRRECKGLELITKEKVRFSRASVGMPPQFPHC